MYSYLIKKITLVFTNAKSNETHLVSKGECNFQLYYVEHIQLTKTLRHIKLDGKELGKTFVISVHCDCFEFETICKQITYQFGHSMYLTFHFLKRLFFFFARTSCY